MHGLVFIHVPSVIRQWFKGICLIFTGFFGLKSKKLAMSNLSASIKFAEAVLTVYSPTALNKMVIEHIHKMSSSGQIALVPELMPDNPAIKILIEVAQMQEEQVKGGSNFFITLSGALLEATEELLKMGIASSEIRQGYNVALDKALKVLDTLCCEKKNNESEIKSNIQNNNYNSFASELYEPNCLDSNKTFNSTSHNSLPKKNSDVDQQELFKTASQSRFRYSALGRKCNIMVYACSLDEHQFYKLVKDAGCFEENEFDLRKACYVELFATIFQDYEVDVVVSLGKFDNYALQLLEKCHIAAVGLESIVDVHRLCKACGAEAALIGEMPDEVQLGTAESLILDKVGNESVAVFQFRNQNSEIKTIVVKNIAHDGFDNSPHSVEVHTFVPGAGATEVELARAITSFSLVDQPSKNLQLAIQKFARALEIFPRSLAENIYRDPEEALIRLYIAHEEGEKNFGLDIQGENWIVNSFKKNLLESYATKYCGLTYSVAVVSLILLLDNAV